VALDITSRRLANQRLSGGRFSKPEDVVRWLGAVRPKSTARLAELTRRYFTSHGPAQLHDFAWWSGLTIADARAGLAMVGRELTQEVIAGRTYWYSPALRAVPPTRNAYLLPLYDE
jgi:hypothetical protein